MNPITVSAQFAAYVWYDEQKNNAGKSCAEAMRFAREHWRVFLPLAQPGLGTLLLKIAKVRPAAKNSIRRDASGSDIQPRAGAMFSCN